MLRRILLLTVTAFALSAVAAQAHTVTASVTCGNAQFQWANFPSSGAGNGGLNTPTWSISFTPQGATSPTFTTSGSVSFAGSSDTLNEPIPAENGSVTLASAWTAAQTRDGEAGGSSGTFTITSCPVTTTTTTTSTVTTTVPVTSTTTTTATATTTVPVTTTSTATTTATTTLTSDTTLTSYTTSTAFTTSTLSTTTTIPVTTTSTATTTEATTSTTTTTVPVTTTTTVPVTVTTTSATPAQGVAPYQQVVCSQGSITLKPTDRVANKHFVALVTSPNAKSVAFYVDGKLVKTLRAPNAGAGRWEYEVLVSHMRYGAHELVAKVTFSCGNPRTGTLPFQRAVPARAVSPNFTG